MIKLLVEREITGATIPIRWCIEKDSLNAFKARMAEEHIKDPYLLLVIVSGSSVEHLLAPFDQMMEYVQLRHPGENKIFATVVWDEKGHKGLWRRFIKRENGQHNNTLVFAGAFDPPRWSIGKAELVIDVPAELFAKKPPTWEQGWVNFFFETRAKDQCQYRRRRILAYTAQPFLVLLWLLLKLGVRWVTIALLLALGLWFNHGHSWSPKNWKPWLRFSPLIHPQREDYLDLFTYDLKDLFGEMGPLVFIFFSLYITFPIGIFVKVVLFIATTSTTGPIGKLFSAITQPLGKIASSVGNALAKLISKIPWPSFGGSIWETAKTKTAEEKTGQPLAAPRDIYQLLLCENTSSVKPKEVVSFRNKIHLQYQDLKMKVCKPFAS
jgi:hypothetical protein